MRVPISEEIAHAWNATHSRLAWQVFAQCQAQELVFGWFDAQSGPTEQIADYEKIGMPPWMTSIKKLVGDERAAIKQKFKVKKIVLGIHFNDVGGYERHHRIAMQQPVGTDKI